VDSVPEGVPLQENDLRQQEEKVLVLDVKLMVNPVSS
jgi:hypothetical protein